MKAKYKDFVNRQQRDAFNRAADEMQKGFAMLYEKLVIYTLYIAFGWGNKRLQRFFDTLGECTEKMKDDPVFWHRVDNIVIDVCGFDYPRSDAEALEKVFYKPPEISAEEKRAAVADMHKMKKFLSQEEQQ